MYKKAAAAIVLAEIVFGLLFWGMLLTHKETQPFEKTMFEVELNQVMLANEKEYMVEYFKIRYAEKKHENKAYKSK